MEQLNKCLEKLQNLDSPYNFEIKTGDAYSFTNLGEKLLGPVGWIGPGQSSPPPCSKVINVTAKFVPKNNMEKNIIVEKLSEIKNNFQKTSNIVMFNHSNHISFKTPIIRNSKGHYEFIRPEWYNEIIPILKKYNVNIEDFEILNEDEDEYGYERNFYNPLLIKERIFVIDKETEYGLEKIDFNIKIPWSIKNKLYLTDERIDEIVELFSK